MVARRNDPMLAVERVRTAVNRIPYGGCGVAGKTSPPQPKHYSTAGLPPRRSWTCAENCPWCRPAHIGPSNTLRAGGFHGQDRSCRGLLRRPALLGQIDDGRAGRGLLHRGDAVLSSGLRLVCLAGGDARVRGWWSSPTWSPSQSSLRRPGPATRTADLGVLLRDVQPGTPSVYDVHRPTWLPSTDHSVSAARRAERIKESDAGASKAPIQGSRGNPTAVLTYRLIGAKGGITGTTATNPLSLLPTIYPVTTAPRDASASSPTTMRPRRRVADVEMWFYPCECSTRTGNPSTDLHSRPSASVGPISTTRSSTTTMRRPVQWFVAARRRAREARRLAALPQVFTLCQTPLLFLDRS
jgi:hypothetical protein